MPARAPDGESARLGALYQLQILDTPREPACDALVELVARSCGAAYAALTFVDVDRVWVKAATRQLPDEHPRAASIASLAVATPATIRVEVAEPDSALADHPAHEAVGDLGTLAAVAVAGPDDLPVGAIELGWRDRVALSPELEALLRGFAAHAAEVISLVTAVGEYDRFVDLSPDAVAILDEAGGIHRVNPAFERLVGVADAGALVGRPFTDLVAASDRSLATSQLARVLFGSGRRTSFDAVLVHDEAGSVPCEVKASHLGGAPSHVHVVVHDLTARLRREEERTRLSEQLARAQRFDTVGQLASGLAHDLNNLLVIMLSNLTLAGESLDDLAEEVGDDRLRAVRADLDEIRQAVDRASQMTGRLLDFARRTPGVEDTADVAEVVETVEGLVARSLGAGTTLEVEVADDLPPAAVDPTHLERALVNLLMNARDALEDGTGTIRLFAQPAVLPATTGGPVPAGPRPGVRLEVMDDGRGMPDEVRARAFEPLFSTKTDQGGSGLGLASVLAFVDEVDGTVRLASQAGVGTSVAVTVPAHGQPPAELPIGVDVPVAGARVIVVDPGERTRRTIAAMLRSAGYRVTTLATGEEALAHAADVGVDLLLAELSLPGMSGRRLLERVAEVAPSVAGVYLSAVDAPSDLDGIPVLVKPFSSMRLLRLTEEALRGS